MASTTLSPAGNQIEKHGKEKLNNHTWYVWLDVSGVHEYVVFSPISWPLPMLFPLPTMLFPPFSCLTSAHPSRLSCQFPCRLFSPAALSAWPLRTLG